MKRRLRSNAASPQPLSQRLQGQAMSWTAHDTLVLSKSMACNPAAERVIFAGWKSKWQVTTREKALEVGMKRSSLIHLRMPASDSFPSSVF
eukprot:CAMPEP_0180641144 /NCGR_PEP_ID=MMETSP1037_2-20121125/46297_1 /TAXON_ID=632150 /ORGANISM="Azadinium spinosum, Strain 3D9" /LENGTH=90 /DNA_ID=CAMNT_0022663911 /DNA_START=565 /DNA_END=840 /DNA_ORIENTATION=-